MATLAYNKRLRHDYTVQEEYEAGIVLTGAEVKACKLHHVSLAGAYVSERAGGLWLKNLHISPYQVKNQPGYDPLRSRKILLRKVEINHLLGTIKTVGLTLLPESLYTTRGLVKVKLVVGRGKKKYDKRAAIKKRDVDRRIAQALRQKI